MRIEELRDKRNDDARHFVDFPEVIFFDELADHIAGLYGSQIVEFEADGVFAVWIEFTYRDNRFFIDNALGDYRFHVEDSKCDDNILLEIVDHMRLLLEKGAADEVSGMDH